MNICNVEKEHTVPNDGRVWVYSVTIHSLFDIS